MSSHDPYSDRQLTRRVLVLLTVAELRTSHNLHERERSDGSTLEGAPMKDVYEVLQQKEADVAHVRHEIQSLKLVSSLLSDELALKDVREFLREKEADVIRYEIENLKIVTPLLSEEFASAELMKTRANSAAEEGPDSDHRSKATGTDSLSSSVTANPRPTFWKRLKRKT